MTAAIIASWLRAPPEREGQGRNGQSRSEKFSEHAAKGQAIGRGKKATGPGKLPEAVNGKGQRALRLMFASFAAIIARVAHETTCFY